VAHAGRGSADDRLAAELAAGKTVRDAAAAVGIAERTAHRRLTDAAFKARVAELRGRMIDAAAGRLADGMTSAADVLRELLTNPDPNVRHKSAAKLIELSLKTRDVTELEGRLAALEQQLAGGAAPGGGTGDVGDAGAVEETGDPRPSPVEPPGPEAGGLPPGSRPVDG
jgi:hypothetical protein